MTDHFTCPSCGHATNRAERCSHCGKAIDYRALAGTGIRADEARLTVDGGKLEIGADATLKPCPHCGAQVSAAAGKCPFCDGAIQIDGLEVPKLEIKGGGTLVIKGGKTLVVNSRSGSGLHKRKTRT